MTIYCRQFTHEYTKCLLPTTSFVSQLSESQTSWEQQPRSATSWRKITDVNHELITIIYYKTTSSYKRIPVTRCH